MRAILSKCLKISVLSLLAISPFLSFSQEKKDKIRIRIEQEIDGKTKVSEKIINASGLSENQKEDMIQKFQDSVMAQSKGKSKGMKIEIENNSNSEIKTGGRNNERNYNYNNNNGDEEIVITDKPRVRVYKKNGKDGQRFDSEEFSHELNGNMESLRDNLHQMGKDLKFEFRTIPDNFFDGGSSEKTIRGVDIFPNNPKIEILNVRFNAPQKGDVSIKVMDVKGNVVAKEEIKDFSGEYVGQINIGKQKGTIFVMITQGEDGTVKRVVLPTTEK